MDILKKRFIVLVLGCMLLSMMSACTMGGSNGLGSSSTPAPMTPTQLLQKTATTMMQLKSISYSMDSSGTTILPGSLSTHTTGGSQKILITIKANGVFVQPGDSKIELSVKASGQSVALSEVTKGQNIYIQNQVGKWFVLKKSDPHSLSLSNTNGMDYGKLLDLKGTKTIDDGTTTINGTRLRHITITFGKDALKSLLNTTGALNSLSATQKQTSENLYQDMTMKNTVLNVWIDETTTLIHRLQLLFDLTIDMSKMTPSTSTTSSGPLTVESNQNTTIDYSKFNAPAMITAPRNATPAINIAQAFQ